ncbi:MAG: carbohydrate ABC transporter permease [Spirochaetales bacterium]|nr:carbohydrate ABC transporter permease [Spirochaetales bacterium]
MRKKTNILTHSILIVLVIVWLIPIYSSLIAALKSIDEFARTPFYSIPQRFAFFENIKLVLDRYRLHVHLFSSTLYAVLATSLAIVFSSMAAYSLIRLKPKFSFLLFVIIYSGTIFPFQMYLIPLHKMFNSLSLYNTRSGLILVYAAITIPFSLFVYRGFFTTIPGSIEDAATIDGCGPVTVFIRIFLPQAAAPTAVIALFQMAWIWNDLLFGLVLSRSENVRPIMVGLAAMSGVGGGSRALQMSGVLMTSIPTILLFIFLKKYFISGMSSVTSLK